MEGLGWCGASALLAAFALLAINALSSSSVLYAALNLAKLWASDTL